MKLSVCANKLGFHYLQGVDTIRTLFSSQVARGSGTGRLYTRTGAGEALEQHIVHVRNYKGRNGGCRIFKINGLQAALNFKQRDRLLVTIEDGERPVVQLDTAATQNPLPQPPIAPDGPLQNPPAAAAAGIVQQQQPAEAPVLQPSPEASLAQQPPAQGPPLQPYPEASLAQQPPAQGPPLQPYPEASMQSQEQQLDRQLLQLLQLKQMRRQRQQQLVQEEQALLAKAINWKEQEHAERQTEEALQHQEQQLRQTLERVQRQRAESQQRLSRLQEKRKLESVHLKKTRDELTTLGREEAAARSEERRLLEQSLLNLAQAGGEGGQLQQHQWGVGDAIEGADSDVNSPPDVPTLQHGSQHLGKRRRATADPGASPAHRHSPRAGPGPSTGSRGQTAGQPLPTQHLPPLVQPPPQQQQPAQPPAQQQLKEELDDDDDVVLVLD